MLLSFEERLSTSPYVERIWRTHSESAGSFTSMAMSQWQMCVWTEKDKTNLTVRGPGTEAIRVPCPADTEFLGIVFKLGSFMPDVRPGLIINGDRTLPDATSQSVWLKGSAWQFPDFENADTFVDHLVRDGLLVREPVVEAALQVQAQDISLRSVQRRFSHSTGLTHGAVDQIERARYATTLLNQGVSILDTVEMAGYFDQPHLTRSLKRFIGYTPAQLLVQKNAGEMSYLFKPTLFE